MKPLREVYLVHKLRAAAMSKYPGELILVREIIKQIRIVQLEHKIEADDEMITELLENLVSKKQLELQLLEQFLNEAQAQTHSAPD